jgi:hypothetical protein
MVMTMKRLMTVIAIAALCSAGCKSQAQKDAEQAADNVKKAAEAVAKAAEQQGTAEAAKGANDMAQAMQGMATALSGGKDGKAVEPVAFQTLQTHLPKVSGWEMEEPQGERMTMPVPFSSVETNYKKGDARVEVKIVDTGFAQLLMAPWSMMLASGYSRESSSGYEKATTIGGNPGLEKWDKGSKNGEIDVLVGKRFMVTIESHDVDDMKVAQEFASNMNFGALASAK